jgi:hypothetical protein
MRKLTIREAVARCCPGWNGAMADRVIAWLDGCGYEIVEKHEPAHEEASLVPAGREDERAVSRALQNAFR